MVTQRTAAKEERAAQKRADILRAAQVKKDMAASKPTRANPEVTPPGDVAVSTTVTGKTSDGLLFGEVISVPNWANAITFTVASQSGPARIELRASQDREGDWAKGTIALEPLYVRPPLGPLVLTFNKEVRDASGTVLSSEPQRVELPGSPGKRFPSFVRVLVWPEGRRSTFTADVSIEFRQTPVRTGRGY